MKTLKALSFSAALAALMLSPMTTNAQGGGALGRGKDAESIGDFSLFDRGSLGGGFNLFNQQFGEDEEGGYELYNQTFGQEGPLGNGLLILVAAGAGYALKKRKNNNKK